MQVIAPFNTVSIQFANEASKQAPKALKAQAEKVDRVPEKESKLLSRNEESPLRRKAAFKVKSAELAEASDKVEELIRSADNLLKAYASNPNGKTDENLTINQAKVPAPAVPEPRVQIRTPNPEPVSPVPQKQAAPAPEKAEAEVNPRPALERPSGKEAAEPSEKIDFTAPKRAVPEKIKVEFEVHELVFEKADQVEIKSEAVAFKSEAPAAKSAPQAHVTPKLEIQSESEPQIAPSVEPEVEPEIVTAALPVEEKPIRDLAAQIQRELLTKTEVRDEEPVIEEDFISRTKIRFDGFEPFEKVELKSAQPVAPEERQLVVEKENLEIIREKTADSVRELADELRRASPAPAPTGRDKIDTLLEKTINDISENRADLKKLKERHFDIEENYETSAAYLKSPAVTSREADRIAAELTKDLPAGELKRAQKKITPDAVSQLLF